MGNKVYIEDFNPSSNSWNRTAILDIEEFDKNVVYTSRYGGVVRIRFVDEDGKELLKKDVVVEERIVRDEKSLTDKKSDATMEKDESDEEKIVEFKRETFE